MQEPIARRFSASDETKQPWPFPIRRRPREFGSLKDRHLSATRTWAIAHEAPDRLEGALDAQRRNHRTSFRQFRSG